MNPAPRPQNRWALIVGVNEYRYLPHARLYGCVNDARAMERVLADLFEFPRENVTLLLDQQATRDAILGAMRRLADQVKRDDVVVFHFSGHGSQMTDREGDEPDGMDETILPHDTGRGDRENRDITDDEIYDWLLELTAQTPYVTLVFDCCHSGTISRDAELHSSMVREVEPDYRPIDELPPSPIRRRRDFKESIGAKGTSGWLAPSERYVLIAACENEQKANEVVLRGSSQGALTYHLVQELRQSPAGTTYRELLDPVAQRIRKDYRNQVPQLEGARDRELFGLSWVDFPRFVPIVDVDGGRVILGGGEAIGVLQDSVWAVHPAGIRQTEGVEPLGRLRVTDVRAASSDAEPLGELPWDLKEPKWAVEESGCFDRHLTVAVEVPAGWEAKGEEMARQIAVSPVLRRVCAGEPAEAKVTLLPVPALDPLDEATWVVMEPGGDVLLPPFRVDGEATARRVVQNLEKKARYRWALALRNRGRSGLAGQVSLSVRRRGRNEEWIEVVDPLGEGVREGEAISIEIVNHHPESLYVYLLDFGLSGQIQMLHPLAGSKDALGKDPVRIGAVRGRELEPYLPDVFPYSARTNGLRRDRGVTTLKLFVSTHPLDLRLLEQKAYREDQRPTERPETPAPRRQFGMGKGAEDWTTVEQALVLRRR
jgi:hypothetical protein